jgi:hypothetical protein
VRTTVQKLENLIAVLLDLVLDVHLATAPVLLLPAEGFVVPTGFSMTWLYYTNMLDIGTAVMLHPQIAIMLYDDAN